MTRGVCEKWEVELSTGPYHLFHPAGRHPLMRPKEKRKLLTSGYQTTIRMLLYAADGPCLLAASLFAGPAV